MAKKLIPGKSKSKIKIQLILVSVVAVASAYSYFAYSRDLFPFTKANKRKLSKLFGGKEPLDESVLLDEFGEPMLGEGLVDEFGSINNPRGGTGARGLTGAGGLNDPAIKGDLELANLYQQELYRQLFLPFEDAPGEGEAIPRDTIIRGGDIPDSRTEAGLSQPYRYPFPVDDRLGDMYGLFPPGGSYGGRDSYSPIHGANIGGKRRPFNQALLQCHNCPPGTTWDSCMCRCAPKDEPRLMCFREECACPGGDDDSAADGDYGGDDGGRRRRGRRRGEEYEEPDIPPIPDIPEWLPDSALAEIGDLRDLRDRLLQELDELQDELQAEIDELNDKIEEEKDKREELEDIVQEIKEEIEEEERDPLPPREREEHYKERIQVIAIAQAGHDGVKAEIKTLSDTVKATHDMISATTSQATAVTGQIKAVATAGSGGTTATAGSGGATATTSDGGRTSRTTSSRTSSRTGSTYGSGGSTSYSSGSGGGTTATAGGGTAVACAGGRCISAGMALRVGYLGRKERQYAFSKLQHRARRMNTMKEKPTSFLKNKQLLNVLPPVVAKRHMASRIALS